MPLFIFYFRQRGYNIRLHLIQRSDASGVDQIEQTRVGKNQMPFGFFTNMTVAVESKSYTEFFF